MPRISRTITTLAITLAGAGLAHATSTLPDAASERQVRATMAANPGSVRLGPSQIQLEPGLIMTLPHGGSTKAGEARKRAGTCRSGYFCIYSDVGLSGASLAMSACKTYILHSYGFYWQHFFVHWDRQASSWRNNQTGGVAARLWSDIGTWFMAPIGARWYIGSTWDDRVVSVRPC